MVKSSLTVKMIIEIIIKDLNSALAKLGYSKNDIKIAKCKNPEFGDFSSSIPLILAKIHKRSPIDIAHQIRDEMILSNNIIEKITATDPGFINFKISKKYYYSVLEEILNKNDFGKSSSGKNKNANVEFVSANPTGPLTIGHGRNAILGDVVSNILEWNGFAVTREYYFNDAGRQMRILSKSVKARYFEILDKPFNFPEDGYEGEYIKGIAKEIINDFGKELLSDDSIFKSFPEKKMFEHIKNTLRILEINFDEYSNEKAFYDNGEIEKLLNELKTKNLIYEQDGATWFKTSSLGKEKDRVFIKSSGEPTYRLPDTAYHRNKVERNFDLIVDVFGADHMDTYPDVILALDALGVQTNHIKVLLYQFVTLLRGGEKIKMSTRKATFISLNDLINEVGVDVVRYFFVMRGINTHLNFDLDLAADQSDKNPVYYLQYAHARICNIIKRVEKQSKNLSAYNPLLLDHESEIDLLKQLELFPNIVLSAKDLLEPQVIANYLQETAAKFHKYYANCRIITENEDLTLSRIALASATKIVLSNGLKILGIKAPEKM
ncbi:MAG: arginine--tRNA ligase [Candidatus Neomarinimicrobiota bacterium]|nr:MAG: arginine--tRNA ligase [bacterium]